MIMNTQMHRVWLACLAVVFASSVGYGAERSYEAKPADAVNSGDAPVDRDKEPALVGYWKLHGDCRDYSGRGNPFWPTLFETGVIPEPLEYRDDKRIIEFAIGLTDLVKRPTRTIEELTREDYAEGRIVLSQKLGEFVPHVIAFNGKNVFEQFAQRRAKLGLQKDPLYGAKVYVLPATDSQHAPKPKDRVIHFRN